MTLACVTFSSVENVTVVAVPATLSCRFPVCEVSSLEHPASTTPTNNNTIWDKFLYFILLIFLYSFFDTHFFIQSSHIFLPMGNFCSSSSKKFHRLASPTVPPCPIPEWSPLASTIRDSIPTPTISIAGRIYICFFDSFCFIFIIVHVNVLLLFRPFRS